MSSSCQIRARSNQYQCNSSRSIMVENAKLFFLGVSLLAASLPQLSAPVSAQSVATAITNAPPSTAAPQQPAFNAPGSGTLLAMNASGLTLGNCPLEHTDVTATISGYVSRVRVKQIFHNNYKHKIEAVYTFPLSDSGAVDSMLMKVGDRTIRGVIKKRDEAREIYERARDAGQAASLLDQERTNIFTQSVANIPPGGTVEITIDYVDLLPFENGQFTFAFPTVVGPRFIPGDPISKSGTGRAADTEIVPDASNITPPVAPTGMRAGHDISIKVRVDGGGIPISNIVSKLHDINVRRVSDDSAEISLMDKATIPNKDFVLSWDVAGDQLKGGYLAYRNPAAKDKSGYFTIMLMPPKQVTPTAVAPKEMIFLIDCSGSQDGQPLEKAKEAMYYILDHMSADDTFQVISFSDNVKQLFDQPRRVSDQMKQKAHDWIAKLSANGGTWMAPAVEKACSIPADEHRLRIVTFMTDGYVGNDKEIIGMIKKLRSTSRWFPFGTGNSVNRMLIDNIAKIGGGEPDYVLLNSSGEEIGKKFYKRIASPVLTDVKIDYGTLQVKEVFPNAISDVWAQRPLYIAGRYIAPGEGTITLSGFAGGKPYQQTMHVNFPADHPQNEVVGSIWARAKVDFLTSQDFIRANYGETPKEIKDEIIATALAHHIMTDYTSFVAVEERVVTKGGESKTIVVPAELPDGVSRENTVGEDSEQEEYRRLSVSNPRALGQFLRAHPRFQQHQLAASSTRTIMAQQSYFAQPVLAPRPQSYGKNRSSRVVSYYRGSGSGYGGAAGARSELASLPPPSALPPPPLAGAGAAASAGPPAPPALPLPAISGGGGGGQGIATTATVEKKAGEHRPKVDPAIQALIDNEGQLTSPAANLQIVHGEVSVKLKMSSLTPDIIRGLQKAGMTIIMQDAKSMTIIGRIKIDSLSQLLALPAILSIDPAR